MKKTFHASERGQQIIEFALTFPVLFLLLMGIFDMGRAVYYNSVLYNAAREGARYGVISPDDTAGIESVVRGMAIGLDPAALTVASSAATPKTINVRLTYQFSAVTPVVASLYGSNTVTLVNEATMRTER